MNPAQATLYENYFENSRYLITYRISAAMSIMLLILGVLFIILEQPVATITFIGFIISTAIAIGVRITKKYRIGAFIFTFIGTVLSIVTLLSIKDAYHFADPLWMIIVSLFAYFTLGKLWGNITIIIQFSAIVFYLIFYLHENLLLIPRLTDGEIYALSFNVFLCGLFIAALIHQFLKRNAYAVFQYELLTNELHSKKELVEQQNSEKTAMLKEIHHRVKNNLQVITSLLRLQSRDLENEEAQLHFNEAIDRIAAMALIHNQMYQSADIGRIELEHYLKTLSKNMISSYQLGKKIQLNFDVKIDYAPSNMMVPIALLFNELVSNSLKHAFINHDNPEISIKIYNKTKKTVQFLYSDNGRWTTPIKEDSFGLELIDTLAQQLNGNVKREIDNGTHYEIEIKLEDEDLAF